MADATMTILRASIESLGRGKLPDSAVLKFLLSKVKVGLRAGLHRLPLPGNLSLL